MLEEKEIEITKSISKKDAGKKFLLKQLPATKMKQLLLSQQKIFGLGQNGQIEINVDKKEEVFFSILENIDCKVVKDGVTTLNRLKKTEIDAFVEDFNTLDFLVDKFLEFNLGECTNLVQKSLDNLMTNH